MKVLSSVLAVLFLLTNPAAAIEYQGQNIDGKVLNAKAYYYGTGGVYDVQVRFNGTRATIYFSDGNKITIQLNQKVITDSKVIEGFGKLGQYPINQTFSVGLVYGSEWEGSGLRPSNPLEGLWRISLENL
jgi:hypothetical protein